MGQVPSSDRIRFANTSVGQRNIWIIAGVLDKDSAALVNTSELERAGVGWIVCFRQGCVLEDIWFSSWVLCRDDERVRASG